MTITGGCGEFFILKIYLEIKVKRCYLYAIKLKSNEKNKDSRNYSKRDWERSKRFSEKTSEKKESIGKWISPFCR